MDRIPFPKPPPAKPLEETAWLRRTDRSEVGRQPFFSGRDREYGVFRDAAKSLDDGDVGGGTMIVQGAPGAGKSALMLECMEAVRQHSTPLSPWVAVSVAPADLKSPAYVMSALIRATDEENTRLAKLWPDANSTRPKKLLDFGKLIYDELSSRGFSLAGVSVGARSGTGSRSSIEMSPAELFSAAAPLLKNFDFVVFVDEAQNTPIDPMTESVLDCLHRDTCGISLVAAFFGLSDTKDVLRECGLSRPPSERVINLGSLSLDESKTSLERMINAYYAGSEEEKNTWVEALAELSQGWPQHINRVGVASGRVIRSNGGRLERHLLEQALQKGNDLKNEYYAARLEAGKYPPWVYKRLALEAAKKQGNFAGTLTYEEVHSLTESARNIQNQSVDEFVNTALHAGLLTTVEDLPFHYRFPIPSLGDYLRSLSLTIPQRA